MSGTLARLPARPRAMIRRCGERLFNAGPDALFLAMRQRYGRRLAQFPSADPPALLRLAAFRRRIPATVESFGVPGRTDLRMVNVESIGTQVIYWTGQSWVVRHGAGLEVWEQLCRRATRIVELGANVGFYTIAGGRSAGGAYDAFEPHPRSCAALRANLELNRIGGVAVVEAAVVATPAPPTVELICTTGTDRAAPSGATVKGSSFELDGPDVETLVVPARPFSDVIAGADLVKLDVEGLEAKLLASARDQLRASPPVLMVEVLEGNTELRELVPQLLEDMGATAYAMHRDHVEPVATDVLAAGPLMQAAGTWDFLFVPAACRPMVEGVIRRS